MTVELLSSDLEGVEEEVTEETNEAQHGAFRDGLIDHEGEEDGMNPKQRDESQSGLCQSEAEKGGIVKPHRIIFVDFPKQCSHLNL